MMLTDQEIEFLMEYFCVRKEHVFHHIALMFNVGSLKEKGILSVQGIDRQDILVTLTNVGIEFIESYKSFLEL